MHLASVAPKGCTSCRFILEKPQETPFFKRGMNATGVFEDDTYINVGCSSNKQRIPEDRVFKSRRARLFPLPSEKHFSRGASK